MTGNTAPSWAAAATDATSLEDFVETMRTFTQPTALPEGTRRHSRRFLFRGVSNDAHALLPSLPRLRNQYPYLTRDDLHEIERQATLQFSEKAHLYLDQRFLPGGREGFEATLHWWQLMQHHGAKTRLLDWTASPFVAVYFAAVAEPEKDGAVWMIDEAAHRRRMEAMFPWQFEGGKRRMPLVHAGLAKDVHRATTGDHSVAASLYFCPCWLPSSRMSAQRGWFSCATMLEIDHGEAMDLAFRGGDAGPPDRFARKVVISHRAKSAVLRDLWRMNITGETMYLGLDGLGKAMAELPALMRPQGPVRYAMEDGLLAEREVQE